MKALACCLMLASLSAFAQQPDPQQQIAALRVIVTYQQEVIDGKTVQIRVLSQELAEAKKQSDDAKPKDAKK